MNGTHYTAEEVRATVKMLKATDDYSAPWLQESARMLVAFADRLEADQQARMVYQIGWGEGIRTYWRDCTKEEISDQPSGRLRRTLYTSPASAERLAEALARISLTAFDNTTPDADKVRYMGRIAHEALAAHATAKPPAEPVKAGAEDVVYPCANCGAARTKAQGGTVFTVCDECWDKMKAQPPAEPVKAVAQIPSQEWMMRVARSWREADESDELSGEDQMLDRVCYVIRSAMRDAQPPAASVSGVSLAELWASNGIYRATVQNHAGIAKHFLNTDQAHGWNLCLNAMLAARQESKAATAGDNG